MTTSLSRATIALVFLLSGCGASPSAPDPSADPPADAGFEAVHATQDPTPPGSVPPALPGETPPPGAEPPKPSRVPAMR